MRRANQMSALLSLAANSTEPLVEATGANAAAALPIGPTTMRLLTKDDVCAVYGISVRCLENWISQGRVPAPVSIGGRRYWHPDVFYRNLANSMGASTEAGSEVAERPVPTTATRAKKSPKVAEQHPAATRMVARKDSQLDAMRRRVGLVSSVDAVV